MSKPSHYQPIKQTPTSKKYDHQAVIALYRKADRTVFGQKHGNTKRKKQ